MNQKTASTIKRDISGTSMDAAGRMVVEPLRKYLAPSTEGVQEEFGSETFFSTVPPVASSLNPAQNVFHGASSHQIIDL